MPTEEQAKDRERLKKYIERERLTCILNNTKWQELYKSLEPIQELLDFKRKDVRESDDKNQRWNGDFYYMFGGWADIEWLQIRAQITTPRGALLEPKVDDRTDDLISAIMKTKVPFSRTEDGVKIWGYVRPGESPEWCK